MRRYPVGLRAHPLRWPRPWQRLTTDPAPAERHSVSTADGLTLALWRVRPVAPDATQGPVMLLHGLAANRRTFHWPGRSLAQFLANAGFDCFLPELRGHGASDRPQQPWTFHDHLDYDVPAFIETILELSGRSRLHWIGHSLGGILLFCHGSLHPNAPIDAAVTIGSALDYRDGSSAFRHLLALRPLLERWRALPYDLASHWLAPTVGRLPTPLVPFNMVLSNVESNVARQFFASAFEPIPTALLSSLATTFTGEGFRSRDGLRAFAYEARHLPWPVLLLAGTRDAQCPVEAVEASATRMARGDLLVFGKRYGQVEDYGHFDLVLGERATVEIWPHIRAHLERRNLRHED